MSRFFSAFEALEAAEKAAFARSSFAVLGLAPGCVEAEVRKAYRQASRLYHPDKQGGKDEAGREQAAAMFLKIQEAYELLSDDKYRAALDAAAARAERAKKVQIAKTAKMDASRRQMREEVERREAEVRRSFPSASPVKPTRRRETGLDATRRENAAAVDRFEEERRKATFEAERFAQEDKKSRDEAAATERALRARKALKVKWSSSRSFASDGEFRHIFGDEVEIERSSTKKAAFIIFTSEEAAVNAAVDENVAKHFKDLRLCSHDAFDRLQAAVQQKHQQNTQSSKPSDDHHEQRRNDFLQAALHAEEEREKKTPGTTKNNLPHRRLSHHFDDDHDDDTQAKRARLDAALRQLSEANLRLGKHHHLAHREYDLLSRLIATAGGSSDS